MAAKAAGADYITLSPVFLTDSKPGYGPALDPDGFHAIAKALDVPALGLAGITARNAPAVRDAGAAGIAVMGDIMRADDPATAMSALIDAWRG
jgi:thiamine-phosphate pyrophosphorylase